MTNSDCVLPASVKTVSLGEKTVYIVGTAHVSKKSVEDVRQTIAMVKPDTVCVELCEARYKSIMQENTWKNMDIFKVVREKKALFLLAQLVMSSFYRRLGLRLDVKPGAEMVEGIIRAQEHGASLVLADRSIEITLKRVWGYLSFWNRMKMMSQILAAMLFTEKIDEKMVEELKNKDQLENVLDTFAQSFPEIKRRLIDERDIFLAQKIRAAPGRCVVAVVGAGHVSGIEAHIDREEPLEPLLTLPPRAIAPILIGFSIPALIIFLFVAGFSKGGAELSLQALYIWVLVKGTFAAASAMLSFAHPLAVLAAFCTAPISTFQPVAKTGLVAGLVQALVKKPTVQDMENLPIAITTVKGFWLNPASRILLVTVIVNLGSTMGTFIAGGLIANKVF